MSIPTQSEMNLLVLKLMTDGKSRTRAQAKSAMRELLQLSSEQCKYRTSSGVPVYESRVSWAISNLNRAGMIQSRQRGVHEITDFGLSVVKKYRDSKAFNSVLRQVTKQHNSWNGEKRLEPKGTRMEEQNSSEKEVLLECNDDISPQEKIDVVFSQFNDEIQGLLLQAILDKSPEFFEQLVVDLLVKMGYGQGYKTQNSSDNGIDGVIVTDALGFDPIHIQAKRYNLTNKVGRPELQGFAGALGAISWGVFITTSSFTKEAIEWTARYPHATLVLIDGKKLTELMMKYNLGVLTERTYEVKRIDGDYFGDE